MKKSHRKDVMIARVVFAFACIVLILLIAGAVMLVRHFAPKRQSVPESQTQSQASQSADTTDSQQIPPETQTQQEPVVEPNPVMRTTTGVNLRKEPNTDCEVVTVLEPGTQLELLGEENGWAFVDYQGQTGYVSVEYLEEITVEVTE